MCTVRCLLAFETVIVSSLPHNSESGHVQSHSGAWLQLWLVQLGWKILDIRLHRETDRLLKKVTLFSVCSSAKSPQRWWLCFIWANSAALHCWTHNINNICCTAVCQEWAFLRRRQKKWEVDKREVEQDQWEILMGPSTELWLTLKSRLRAWVGIWCSSDHLGLKPTTFTTNGTSSVPEINFLTRQVDE